MCANTLGFERKFQNMSFIEKKFSSVKEKYLFILITSFFIICAMTDNSILALKTEPMLTPMDLNRVYGNSKIESNYRTGNQIYSSYLRNGIGQKSFMVQTRRKNPPELSQPYKYLYYQVTRPPFGIKNFDAVAFSKRNDLERSRTPVYKKKIRIYPVFPG